MSEGVSECVYHIPSLFRLELIHSGHNMTERPIRLEVHKQFDLE